MLASHMLSPLGMTIPIYTGPINKLAKWAHGKLKGLLKAALECNLETVLYERTASDWDLFGRHLSRIHSTLNADIQLYSGILPPEILGKFLSVRTAFWSVSTFFELAPELLLNEEEQWPTGRRNDELKEFAIKALVNSLEKYFEEVRSLFDLLERQDYLDTGA